MGAVTIGVDIGQKHDPTAIAVIEKEWRGTEEHFVARHLERLPLGTSYPKVAERLAEVARGAAARAQLQAEQEAFWRDDWRARQQAKAGVALTIYLDATGVGQPVVDLMKAAGVSVTPVYFTHGDRRSEEWENGGLKVSLGKAHLVSRLQVLLQTQRIHLPDTAEARTLARELQDYEIRVDEQANDRYGAFAVGTHDDLVTALGLAVQQGKPRGVTQINTRFD